MTPGFDLSARLNSPCPEDTFSIFNSWAVKATGNFPQCIRNSDHIIAHLNRYFQDIHKLSALELGSLEGHLSVTFDKHFRQLTCIEGRPYHYLKALVAKELLGLKAKILCGNFIDFLRETDETWDVIIATGVLYHMHNPIELIKLMSQHSDRLCIRTIYWDKPLLLSTKKWHLTDRKRELVLDGHHFIGHVHHYGHEKEKDINCDNIDQPNHVRGWGGIYKNKGPCFLSKEDIAKAVRLLGYTIYHEKTSVRSVGPFYDLYAGKDCC